ncbi:MAG: hypothetical protein AAFX50_14500, partial [Acidobacteriota bacterium]
MRETGTSDPPSPARLRRQILSQAVADNVSEKSGERRRAPDPRPAAPAAPRRAHPLLWLIPVLVLVAALPMLRGDGDAGGDAEDAVLHASPAPAAAVPAVGQPVIATPLFDAPRPIDFDVIPL